MKFTIEITKEVIDESLMCGTPGFIFNISANCAFAIAYNELIPNVRISSTKVHFMTKEHDYCLARVSLTSKQAAFIQLFDSMYVSPKDRYELVGQKFEVEIPDEVIQYWHNDIVSVAQKLVNSNILKPIENEC